MRPAAASRASRTTPRASAEEEIGEAGEQGLVPFITDNVLPGSFVQPFVENEILRILVLGILTAAAVSFLADAERKKVVAVFEVPAGSASA